MKKYTFADVLIEPKFNKIQSRKDVDLSTKLGDIELKIPVISSNMDTVTGPSMATAMFQLGAVGCLHRFSSIEKNLEDVKGLEDKSIVSLGLGEAELKRGAELYKAGVRHFCIDVAHGASLAVVEQLKAFKQDHSDAYVIVGNFASVSSVKDFLRECWMYKPDALKIGVGPGSACTTRIKTGVGYPQLSAIEEIHHYLYSDYYKYNNNGHRIQLIADGGMKTPGDIAKALAAGADLVMLGGMLAGTYETPGEVIIDENEGSYKRYRGSASKESYEAQGKDDSWRAAEGEAFNIPFRGPVELVMRDIEGGLRSSLTYVGAQNLREFKDKVRFIHVTPATSVENGAHGKDG